MWLKQDKYYNKVKAAFTGEVTERFFNTNELVKLLDDHMSGKADNSRKIWTVYSFLIWFNVYFVERTVPPKPVDSAA